MNEDVKYDILARSAYVEASPRYDHSTKALQYEQELQDARTGQLQLRRYFDARGISPLAAKHFRMGYRPDRAAITFPYWNLEGVATGIKLRVASGDKFSEDNSSYGLYNVADINGKPKVVIAEGETDSLSSWTTLPSSFSVCGISGAVHTEQTWNLWALDLLFAQEIWLALDADDAGDKGSEVAMRMLGDKARRLRPTRGKDWSDSIMAGEDMMGAILGSNGK